MGENCHPELEDVRYTKGLHSIPFLHLPEKLPAHLTQLIPHYLACELRCAPVGRDHHALTVAMADPLDIEKRSRLQSVTGMTIFPVACKEEDLDALLANTW